METKGEKREAARDKKRYGMKVSGTSARLVFQLGVTGRKKKRKGR